MYFELKCHSSLSVSQSLHPAGAGIPKCVRKKLSRHPCFEIENMDMTKTEIKNPFVIPFNQLRNKKLPLPGARARVPSRSRTTLSIHPKHVHYLSNHIKNVCASGYTASSSGTYRQQHYQTSSERADQQAKGVEFLVRN